MNRIFLFGSAVALAASAAAPAAYSRPFHYAYKGKYAELEFSWSAEAAAVPALAARLRSELAKERATTIRGGREEYAIRQRSGSPGVGWQSITKITTSGETPRLLSLSRQYYAFTGGAHGNGGTTGLLWDRKLGKEITFGNLFSSPHDLQRLRAPYCHALSVERTKRRGGDGKLGNGVSEFDACPKLSELALIPSESKGKARFDQVHLIAAPYLAGPYVEGEYDIVLPVTRQLLQSIKPVYRSSFEPQRQ